MNFTMCQPNWVSNGFEVGFSLDNENAWVSNSSELNCPEAKRFNTPPLEAEDLSSENCLANSSNFSPCCNFL